MDDVYKVALDNRLQAIETIIVEMAQELWDEASLTERAEDAEAVAHERTVAIPLHVMHADAFKHLARLFREAASLQGVRGS